MDAMHAGPTRRNPLKVLAPLGVAVFLTGLFVYLLVRQSQEFASGATGVDSVPVAAVTPPREFTADPERIPQNDPTAPDLYKKPERPRPSGGNEFFRWNLKDFPEGWDPDVARAIHALFEEMEYDSLDEDETALRVAEARKELEGFLASLGPNALPTLATILNAEGDFVARRFLLVAIGNLGPESEEATWILRDFLFARYEDPANRSEAYHIIKNMGNLRNETSFKTLNDLIGDRRFASYRHKLVVALGDHPRREEAIGTFVDSMATGNSFQTRNMAAQALGKVRSPEALSDLYHSYKRERIWYAKQTILGTIGKIGNPNSIGFLENEARGAQESGVRLSAASALRRIGTPYAWRLLAELGRSEPDAKVREHINRWLREGQ